MMLIALPFDVDDDYNGAADTLVTTQHSKEEK
jgi:hypothetical protein